MAASTTHFQVPNLDVGLPTQQLVSQLSSDKLMVRDEDAVLEVVTGLSKLKSASSTDSLWKCVRYAFLSTDAISRVAKALDDADESIPSPSGLRIPPAAIPFILKQLVLRSQRQADKTLNGAFGCWAFLQGALAGNCSAGSISGVHAAATTDASLAAAALRPRDSYAFTLDVHGNSNFGLGAGLSFIWVDPSEPLGCNDVSNVIDEVAQADDAAAAKPADEWLSVDNPSGQASTITGSRALTMGAHVPSSNSTTTSGALSFHDADASSVSDGGGGRRGGAGAGRNAAAAVDRDARSLLSTASESQRMAAEQLKKPHGIPRKYAEHIKQWGDHYACTPLVLNGAQCALAVREASCHPEFRMAVALSVPRVSTLLGRGRGQPQADGADTAHDSSFATKNNNGNGMVDECVQTSPGPVRDSLAAPSASSARGSDAARIDESAPVEGGNSSAPATASAASTPNSLDQNDASSSVDHLDESDDDGEEGPAIMLETLWDVYLFFATHGAWIQCVDIARLAVLWLAGGGTCYLDTDMEIGSHALPKQLVLPLALQLPAAIGAKAGVAAVICSATGEAVDSQQQSSNVTILERTPLLVVAQDADGILQNNFIAVNTPCHPFITLLLQAVTAAGVLEDHVVHATGPALFTALYHCFRRSRVTLAVPAVIHEAAGDSSDVAAHPNDVVAAADVGKDASDSPIQQQQQQQQVTLVRVPDAVHLNLRTALPSVSAADLELFASLPQAGIEKKSSDGGDTTVASAAAAASSSSAVTPGGGPTLVPLSELTYGDIVHVCPPSAFYPKHWRVDGDADDAAECTATAGADVDAAGSSSADSDCSNTTCSTLPPAAVAAAPRPSMWAADTTPAPASEVDAVRRGQSFAALVAAEQPAVGNGAELVGSGAGARAGLGSVVSLSSGSTCGTSNGGGNVSTDGDGNTRPVAGPPQQHHHHRNGTGLSSSSSSTDYRPSTNPSSIYGNAPGDTNANDVSGYEIMEFERGFDIRDDGRANTSGGGNDAGAGAGSGPGEHGHSRVGGAAGAVIRFGSHGWDCTWGSYPKTTINAAAPSTSNASAGGYATIGSSAGSGYGSAAASSAAAASNNAGYSSAARRDSAPSAPAGGHNPFGSHSSESAAGAGAGWMVTGKAGPRDVFGVGQLAYRVMKRLNSAGFLPALPPTWALAMWTPPSVR